MLWGDDGSVHCNSGGLLEDILRTDANREKEALATGTKFKGLTQKERVDVILKQAVIFLPDSAIEDITTSQLLINELRRPLSTPRAQLLQ